MFKTKFCSPAPAEGYENVQIKKILYLPTDQNGCGTGDYGDFSTPLVKTKNKMEGLESGGEREGVKPIIVWCVCTQSERARGQFFLKVETACLPPHHHHHPPGHTVGKAAQ